MPVSTEIIEQIRQNIIAAADPQTQIKVSKLVSGAKAIGVTVPNLRQLATDFRRQHAKLTLAEACDLMDALCSEQCREEILFGVFLLGRYGKKASSIEWPRLSQWVKAVDNWETCDQLASIVGGPMVAANLRYVEYLDQLAHSDNLWERRFAVATVCEINHKGQFYPAETFRVCSILLADSTPMVWKAVGWAIREISKKDELLAFQFLQENRAKIFPRLLREASEKLSTEHKQQLLND